MSEMIERVAKALYDNMCLANPHVMTTWEALSWDLKSYYSEQARAAIEAIREPTDDMVDAANALDEVSKGVLITPIPARAWEAMIDAALVGDRTPDAACSLPD